MFFRTYYRCASQQLLDRVFQVEIVSWLVEELASLEEDVDQLASGGNSPLHLAAKRGNVAAVSTLLNAGAQVDLKNDLGLRAYDVAVMAGRPDAAEFLLLYETSLKLSRDLLEANNQKERSAAELSDLSTYFK